MSTTSLDLLRFRDAYFERIWGGHKLAAVLGKDSPPDKVIGEDWLVVDHAEHESVVAEGPLAGTTLRELVERDAAALLGTRAELTPHGRFPLLLKLIDAAQALSVQVHPDDAAAERLREPDVGKTERGHVFDADPGSELICGLEPDADAEAFARAIEEGAPERLMRRFEALEGTTAFVPAGTVHAIGGGLLLSEIQQNSNITYRVFDWNRVGADGKPRELHVDKALAVTHFGSSHAGPARPLAYEINGARVEVLAACGYFAAELLHLDGEVERDTRGDSFRILLAKQGPVDVAAGATNYRIEAGAAALVCGCQESYRASGSGQLLDYYVPDLERDVLVPLRAAGHARDAIVRLGGAAEASDLAR